MVEIGEIRAPPIRAFFRFHQPAVEAIKAPAIATGSAVYSTLHRTLRYPPNKQSWPPSPAPPLPSLPAPRSPGASPREPPRAFSASHDDVPARFFSTACERSFPIGLSNRCLVRSGRPCADFRPFIPRSNANRKLSAKSQKQSRVAFRVRAAVRAHPRPFPRHHRRVQISPNDKTFAPRAPPETRAAGVSGRALGPNTRAVDAKTRSRFIADLSARVPRSRPTG